MRVIVGSGYTDPISEKTDPAVVEGLVHTSIEKLRIDSAQMNGLDERLMRLVSVSPAFMPLAPFGHTRLLLVCVWHMDS